MAFTEKNLAGYVRADDGSAVSGITISLLHASTDSGEIDGSAETTTTTNSTGYWSFTETSLDANYDIKIAGSGGNQVRYIPWVDEITLKTVDTAVLKVRGATNTSAAPIYLFADQADDAGDGWRIQATDSDTLAIGSNKASASAIIDYITITNGATAAASNTTILGQLTIGVDDTGADVKFFGATSGAYLLWDESADKLLTAGNTFIDIVKDKLMIGSTAVTTTAAELNVLDAVTAGTVTASLGVVVDSNKDIGTFRNLTINGVFTDGNYTFDTSGNVSGLGTVGSGAITSSGIIKTDNATEATSTTNGSLQTDGGLSVVKDAVFGDDLILNSDAAVFSMGGDSGFSITHDGDVGATIAGSPITITAAEASTWSTSAGALTITSAAAATWSTAAGVLTIDGDDGIVMQTTGSGGVDIKEDLTLTSVSAGATGPTLNLFHDTGSASATGGQDTGDRLGVIDFLDTDGTIRGEINCALEGNTSQAGFHFRLAGDATNDKLYISRDGNATLLGTLTESSDERLKANVATLTGSLAKVKQMRGVSFTRNDLTDKTQTHLGLIAQELEPIAPELVSTGANGFKSVAYSQLASYLIEAIKELDTRIVALE